MRNLPLALLPLCAALACALPPERGDGPSPRVAELVAEGRDLLDADEPVQAQVLFEQADELDDGSLRTRVWLLRAWMEQGMNNATLDELDALGEAGHEGPDMDYLYGMAFARRAEENVALGVTDMSVRMNFQDASAFLTSAVEANPDRFHDAFIPLATAAWMSQDLESARAAAETAVEKYDDNGAAAVLLGRIALSQFQVAQSEAEWNEEAEAHWAAAWRAFNTALARFGQPMDIAMESQVSEAYVQLGHTLLWKERTAEAADAYVGGITWAADALDYSQLQGLLDAPTFNRALEAGWLGFTERQSEVGARDASLLWWLGWSRLTVEQNEAAADAFLASVEKSPEYVNAFFFAAIANYATGDYDDAVELLRRGWEADPETVVASMQQEQELNLAKVSYMVGWCAQAERLADAALLSRISAETATTDATYWNNLGLFLRDRALALDGEEAVHISAAAMVLLEEAFEAYSRALELAPTNPQLINDTAVMLHYYLQRDWDQVLEMYATAKILAEDLLAGGDLSDELRPVIETALEDAVNNTELLIEHREMYPDAGGPRPRDTRKREPEESAATESPDDTR